ncbi:MAG: ribonuclease R [Bacteroidales bacterium]|nr:ribonuclease R [Bacteroidales bacterium]MDD3960608.1 ribonuclease R [Bacteroidales bacterium]MDY0286440.1 ribonuclease R [Bacteroidales bacterium]HPE86848.1 ribonuclease R [Bacteroidales bacterium]
MPKKKSITKKTIHKLSRNSFMSKVLEVFTTNPAQGFNFRQISGKLGITDTASRELVHTMIKELRASNAIVEMRRGKYRLNPEIAETMKSDTLVEGIVDMKQTGKAYVISDQTDEDIFINAGNTGHALHGDRVEVQLFPRRSGRKIEGRIKNVLQRAKNQFVGTLQASNRFAFVVPDQNNVPVDIYIAGDQLHGAKNGEKVLVKMIDWPAQSKNPFGEIVEVLGMPGNNDVEMLSILANNDFPLHFPKIAEKEAEAIPAAIPQEEIKKRRDMRGTTTLTIDPADAKDFDDALSFKVLENGNFEIGIHIADVSYYVKPGTEIDKEAYFRATSVYLVDRTIPMLPEKLSNNLCSLRPNEDKLCFSAIFELDEEAKILQEWFGKTIINSDRRFNYEEVQQIIEGGNGDLKKEILILDKLAKKLRDKRFKMGSINFKSQEVKFKLDENGKPLEAFLKEQKDSNHLVEDFMLLANRKVAERVGKQKSKEEEKTFVYRIHDTPNPDKLADFAEFVNKFGYKLNIGNRKNIAKSMNELFKAVAGKGEENMIETIAIRTMAKAIYSTKNLGHYGLAFAYYSHFTSPIRRYPDLMVHRLLEKYLKGGQSVPKLEYEEKCKHCSDMEKKATEAERDSVKYKQAEFMLDKVGMEFPGLISGVSKWGLFVEIEGNKCEGLVRMEDIPNDFYYLDEENYCVIGHHDGKMYRLGDKVRIIVKKIDLQKKQMDFMLA